jgi:hypothetical protein
MLIGLIDFGVTGTFNNKMYGVKKYNGLILNNSIKITDFF